MNINIKKRKLTIKEERKLKLNSLKKKKAPIDVNFNWIITTENKEEEEDKLKNFQLFCIRVTQNILASNFTTNEKGIIKCAHNINKNDIEYTVAHLQKLYLTILNEKEK
jgi:hypothetical protein